MPIPACHWCDWQVNTSAGQNGILKRHYRDVNTWSGFAAEHIGELSDQGRSAIAIVFENNPTLLSC